MARNTARLALGIAALFGAAGIAASLSAPGPRSGPSPDRPPSPAIAAERETASAGAAARLLDLPPEMRWESFTVEDGLPSDKVFSVRIDGDAVWAGTTKGLGLYRNGRWTSFGVADGLPHPIVLAIDVCRRTGDVWIGTMGGLARYSAGRIDAFTQLTSGLSNDFVHGVRCDPDEDVVWVATAMGANRLDLRSGRWSIYTHENTPMHEPWTYSIAITPLSVFVGAWGAGILEYTKEDGRWREYRDPDKEFEVDMFPDDGPVSDITSAVDVSEGTVWQSSYFGAARYDGREWQSYFIKDSGLASDFINFVRAQGRFAWFATDQGLSATDGEDWVTYRRLDNGSGETTLYRGSRLLARQTTPTALPHNYILGADAAGDHVWVATERGVGHGVRTGRGLLPASLRETVIEEKPPTLEAEGERFRYGGAPEPLLPFARNRPYYQLFKERPMFRGAGREEPEARPAEVLIGFIGPLKADYLPTPRPAAAAVPVDEWKSAVGLRMLRACILAVEEANKAGGYKGIPFRVVPRTDMVLWGQSSNELVGFMLDDKVWGVVTGLDSNHNHVMSRATLKLEMPIISAGSSDPTLVEHAIPWLVRCISDERQHAFALLNEIVNVRGLQRPALLRVNDRDGRTGVDEFVQGARRLGRPVIIEQRFANGDSEFRSQLDRIVEAGSDSIVLWGNPRETGLAVRQARALGIGLPLFGCDRMAQREFLEAAGGAAEGVTLSVSMNTDTRDPAWIGFRDRYKQRWQEDPDSFAGHAYDGARLLVGAILKAGLNRALIRDALFDHRTYDGVTGRIVFDTNMTDIRAPWLATVREGRFQFAPSPPWPQDAGGIQPAAERTTAGQSIAEGQVP